MKILITILATILTTLFSAVVCAQSTDAGNYLCALPSDEVYGTQLKVSFVLSESNEVQSMKFWEEDATTGTLTTDWFDVKTGVYTATAQGFDVNYENAPNGSQQLNIFVMKDMTAYLNFSKGDTFSAITINLICQKL